MRELPTGTVTFLFTDIEGSTRLLAGQPERYGALLAEHHRLLRQAFDAHGGHEVGTEGDAFFVAFTWAPDALAAAVAAQRALARDGSGVRVRIGVHTGGAAVQDGDYVGLDVHRAARIAAAGHGGQVLVSAATHALVEDELPPDVGLRDLGAHRLKDLDRPERLFQVVARGLPADFPPPASLAPARARLPTPATLTVGREADLARLSALLHDPARLVTVVGPGGVGKTRLALELARATGDGFADGAAFVPLAPVREAAHVAATVARQLDVVLLPGEPVEAGLARHLAERDALVVLDNFEHVLDAAPLVSDLLAATVRLRILVTSREPLHLQAERVIRIDPLAVAGPAVELFDAVARARDAGFSLDAENAEAVAHVCRRLDGLPLAIELAAARIGVLTAPELAARLDDGLAALGSGPRDAPARQRTLQATLQWSYDLLSPEEQDALAGLAVFAGGCTVDAAQAVTGASLDVLDALVDKNLVVHRPVAGHASRLHLLETVAAFARERRAERQDDRHERHFDHYLGVALRAAPELERSSPPELIAELDLELHNLRAAIAWALDRGEPQPALQLLSALQEYWDQHEELGQDAVGWLQTALASSPDDVSASGRAAALSTLGFLLASPDTVEEGLAAARESRALARSLGDRRQEAVGLLAQCAVELAVHRVEDVYRHAIEAEALAAAARDELKHRRARRMRAIAAPSLEEALEIGEDVAASLRRAGADRWLVGQQTSLTYTALYFADYAAAARLDAESLALAERLGDPRSLAFAYGNHGLVAVLTGATEEAGRAFGRELEVAARYGYHRLLYEAIAGLATVAAAHGEDDLAARLSGAAETTGPDRHDPVIAEQIDACAFAAARARLGERAWRSAHAAGAALTLDEAVDLARLSTGSRALGPA